MFNDKTIKTALKEMFESGELAIDVVKQPKEPGDFDHYNVQVKIDGNVVYQNGTIVIQQV